ncbi:MAG: phenylacetate-CoA oxygenase subunit PaaJ [Saprospiraceae bacterium]|nr:phenylacetate-CoA oxygenase subunit PaaJ [Saprospiraceae bacterium]MCB9326157.1 phenylacetate-CoA oxygenase subunit PaaJ [Lewinellaceae bacterium]
MEKNEKYFRELLEEVKDPEIPVLSIVDLGIVRDVKVSEGEVEVIITPTYSGCPAMDFIEVNIKSLLQHSGIDKVKVTTVLHPAWTTDWISSSGKEKLRAYGIAPPVGSSPDKSILFGKEVTVACPRCGAEDTTMISLFGSTACKSLYKCNACKEPFDYFKCH